MRVEVQKDWNEDEEKERVMFRLDGKGKETK